MIEKGTKAIYHQIPCTNLYKKNCCRKKQTTVTLWKVSNEQLLLKIVLTGFCCGAVLTKTKQNKNDCLDGN